MSYFWLGDRRGTGHLGSHQGRSTGLGGPRLRSEHFDHRHRDKDRGIYFARSHGRWDSRCSIGTRACNLDCHCPKIQVNRNRRLWYYRSWVDIGCWHRREMVGTGQLGWDRPIFLQIQRRIQEGWWKFVREAKFRSGITLRYWLSQFFRLRTLVSETVQSKKLEIQVLVYLLIGKQSRKGSPLCLGGQLQMGLWFRTVQSAFGAQALRHGLIHLLLRQARVCSHSALVEHSGLQLGGCPKKPGRHEQEACSLNSRHMLLAPQGDGVHGLRFSVVSAIPNMRHIFTTLSFLIFFFYLHLRISLNELMLTNIFTLAYFDVKWAFYCSIAITLK